MNIFRSALMCLLLFTSTLLTAQEFNVISYNIRFNNAFDNENWWGHRKEAAIALLNAHSPVVFGVQEAVLGQMKYIDDHMPDYSYVGVGRDDGKEQGEFSAVFYDNRQVELLTSGTFWLSPSPEIVSKGWDAALPRVCTYAEFEHKASGKKFWFFNTHFDHVGEEARANSAQLIVDKIKQIAGDKAPIVLSGDFNTTPDKAPYGRITAFMDDASALSPSGIKGPIGTFNGFKLDAELKNRIDYVFTKNLNVLNYAHLDTKRDNGLWVSDHLPVVVKIAFR
ncbi:endonuclease/exonuclease/phosphatase family protein [Roseivirga thermotolerans]|uniref:Endonuclease n=1 Tax=Roseivirga thermotolerans TaxID=1758176 RepID=A0ABQ3IB96_9BACT|nr:endonuclease/exonuclease/phosphatase family protein [Roseivirga thermotolerans]GHE71102.1 endonuclease [Roseivirga thermotolerans]